jgi:hypothetical protein
MSFGLSAKAFVEPPILLTIDDSNPSDVIITTTGAFADTYDTKSNEQEGIELLNFFTHSLELSDPIHWGSLTPSGRDTVPYNSWGIDDASGCNHDLHLWASDGREITQQFATHESAFKGTYTINLCEYAAELPGAGTTGDILAGDSKYGDIIGRWEIVCVPEPSQYGMWVALAVVGAFGYRRFFVNRQA